MYKNEVDWNGELGAITRINGHKNGPALLFENIKGYTNTACKKLFTFGFAARFGRPSHYDRNEGTLPESGGNRQARFRTEDRKRLTYG